MDEKRATNLTIGVLLAIGGLVTAGWIGPQRYAAANDTAHWDERPALVEETRLAPSTDRRGSTDWSVVVAYRYEVDGATYTSDAYSVNGPPNFERRADAETWSRAFRPGDEITAYVDPSDPPTAVLERGGVGEAAGTIAFGALLLGLGVFVALRARRRPVTASND